MTGVDHSERGTGSELMVLEALGDEAGASSLVRHVVETAFDVEESHARLVSFLHEVQFDLLMLLDTKLVCFCQYRYNIT